MLKDKILKTACTSIACIGWILFFGGLFWVIIFFHRAKSGMIDDLSEIQLIFYGISSFSFDFFFIGISAVIASRYFLFIINQAAKPSLILRCSDKIFYAFAFLLFLWAFFRYKIFDASIENLTVRFLYQQPSILPAIAKAILLILIGTLLKRSIPAIQEYKATI